MAGLTRADLTTIANRTGRKVVAAWSSHDEGAMGTVYGVVLHHTGSAWGTAVAPTLQIVREGRSDLVNALSTFYIDRAGTIYLVTEKIAWHAGQGSYRGITDGNGHLLGIEAESDGVHWTTETVDAYVALVAEICRYLGADVDTWAIRHATWATPRGRKTDFSGLSETDFKTRVKARIAGTPTPEDDDMTPAQEAKLDWLVTEILGPGRLTGGKDGIAGLGGRTLQQFVAQIPDAVVTHPLHSGNDPRGDWSMTDRLPAMDVALNDLHGAMKTPAPVQVDAAGVAAALAGNTAFVAALAKAVNDDAAKRMSA